MRVVVHLRAGKMHRPMVGVHCRLSRGQPTHPLPLRPGLALPCVQRPLGRFPLRAAGKPSGPVDTVMQELSLQSNRLNPDLRDRVCAAITKLGGRVTVGDVSAQAGVKMAEAEEALKALAFDSLGHLEVSACTQHAPAYKCPASTQLLHRFQFSTTPVCRPAPHAPVIARSALPPPPATPSPPSTRSSDVLPRPAPPPHTGVKRR